MRRNSVKLSTIGGFLVFILALSGFILAGKANGWFDKEETNITETVQACVEEVVTDYAV